MTATTAPTTAPTTALRARWLLSDTVVLTRRNLSHVRQIPEKLFDVTLQPIMFVLLFAYVFGGVIAIPGGDYHDYLIGGILVQTLAFGMMGPGVSIATDLTEGFVDRFRSLPTSRSAYLLGHVTAEFAATTLALVILSLTGLIVGWGIHTDVAQAAAAYALLSLFALAMICVGTFVGMTVRSGDAVQGIAFVLVFPLTFISTVFVPADGLPEPLKTFAMWNPISVLAAAVRTLFGNPTATPADAAWPLQHPVIGATIWCVALLAIALPLTLARFRARTTD